MTASRLSMLMEMEEQGASVISLIKDEFIPPGNLDENKRAAVAPGLVERKEEGDGREEKCIIHMINYVCEPIMTEEKKMKVCSSVMCT